MIDDPNCEMFYKPFDKQLLIVKLQLMFINLNNGF